MRKFFIIFLPNILRICLTIYLIYLASDSINTPAVILFVLLMLYGEGSNLLFKKYNKSIRTIQECLAEVIKTLQNHKEGIELTMIAQLLVKYPFLAKYTEKPNIKDPNTQ
jgi:hypothetical protein